jgi:cysteine desulfurase
MTPIYLDHHATTPVDPRVVDAMLPYFSDDFGNAASRQHAFGWRAEAAVERAREQVAALVGADPRGIVFTSGATESNNLAILGAVLGYAPRREEIVTAATEHRSVLDPCDEAERRGARPTRLPVDGDGRIDLGELRRALSARTLLVSVMHANNEIGVLQPIAEIGRICKEQEVLFHSDAAQSAGKVPLDVEAMGIDLLSLSAHKIYGPKGVGALWVRGRSPRVRLAPLLHGGGHERGLRSGTLNVPAIVGFGRAAEIARAEMVDEAARLLQLREHMRRRIEREIPEVRVNGSLEHRLPANLNVSFDGVDGEALLLSLEDVAVSSGSACTSATAEPSHVLRALGLRDDLARASLRFGLGRWTTREEVDHVVDLLREQVARLRAESPTWELSHAASRGA